MSFEGDREELRVRFLARLDVLGNVTVVARELGINQHTAQGWAKRAGWRSPHGGRGRPRRHPRRDEYEKLRAGGVPRRRAAAQIGVNVRTAQDWDRGVVKSRDARTYVDGRRVDYALGATTMGAVPTSLSSLDKVLHPRFLALNERERIRDLLGEGHSCREVARRLGRAPSTITGEIAANTVAGVYRPYAAQRASAAAQDPQVVGRGSAA